MIAAALLFLAKWPARPVSVAHSQVATALQRGLLISSSAAKWPAEPVTFQFDSPDKSVSFVQSQGPSGLQCSLMTAAGAAKWTLPKPLDAKPYRVLFAANGALVLLQTWGSEDSNPVLGFIDPYGAVGKSYSEKQLFPKMALFQPDPFPSSHWWEDNPDFLFSPDGGSMVLYTEGGSMLTFDTSNGNMATPMPGIAVKAIEDSIRPLFAASLWRQRSHAARVAGAFKFLDFLPAIKRLLNDPYVEQSQDADHEGGDPEPHLCRPVQLAAGKALIELQGPQALPLIQSKVNAETDSLEKQRWLTLLNDPRLH